MTRNIQTDVEMRKGRHEVLQRHRMSVQNVIQNTIGFIAIADDAVGQGLCKDDSERTTLDPKRSVSCTSLMCAFKKEFLMYHVEVKKVSAKMTRSFLPESSRRSGE